MRRQTPVITRNRFPRTPTPVDGQVRPRPQVDGQVRPRPQVDGQVRPRPQVDGQVRPRPQVDGQVRPRPQVDGQVRPRPQVDGQVRPRPQVDGQVRPRPQVDGQVESVAGLSDEATVTPPSSGLLGVDDCVKENYVAVMGTVRPTNRHFTVHLSESTVALITAVVSVSVAMPGVAVLLLCLVSSRSAHQQVSGPLTAEESLRPPSPSALPAGPHKRPALPSPGAGGITPLEPLSRMVFWIQLASFQGSVDYGTWRNGGTPGARCSKCALLARGRAGLSAVWIKRREAREVLPVESLGVTVASMTTRRRSLVPSPVAWWLPAGPDVPCTREA
ncbi:unnamed protein product [Boreogadus saida]